MSTLIIALVLAAAAAGVVTKMISDKKAGKSGCGCGCAGCPHASGCHEKKSTE